MPMNAGAAPRKSETHPEARREVLFFAAADSHWSTCPDREAYKSKTPLVRAYFSSDFVPETKRWHWTLLANDRSHSKEIARSVISYPTQHDANFAAKAVRQQIKNAEVET